MKKNSLCSLSVAFLVVEMITHFPGSACGDLVTETCKQTPNYELCVSTLRADPRSKIVDVSGLGLLIIYAAKSQAISATLRIDELMKSSPELKAPLNECDEYYHAVLFADIPSSLQALRLGDPKFAESGMADAANEASFCEQAFDKGQSPLTKLNKLVGDLSLIASAIAKTLL